jgi:hypothetical protein
MVKKNSKNKKHKTVSINEQIWILNDRPGIRGEKHSEAISTKYELMK